MISVITFFLFPFVFVFTEPTTSITLKGIAIEVKDGDSFVLYSNGKTYAIRLAEIDCPEYTQDYGKEARSYTASYIENKTVKCECNSTDKYNRLICEVNLASGENLNMLLVSSGNAWHFKRYSESTILAGLEEKARSQKIGLWQFENPVAPWEFRASKK